MAAVISTLLPGQAGLSVGAGGAVDQRDCRGGHAVSRPGLGVLEAVFIALLQHEA